MYKITIYDRRIFDNSAYRRREMSRFTWRLAVIGNSINSLYDASTFQIPTWWADARCLLRAYLDSYTEDSEVDFVRRYSRSWPLRKLLECMELCKNADDLEDPELTIKLAKILTPGLELVRLQIHGRRPNDVADIVFEPELNSEEIAVFTALYFDNLTDVRVEYITDPAHIHAEDDSWFMVYDFKIPDESNPRYKDILRGLFQVPEDERMLITRTASRPDAMVNWTTIKQPYSYDLIGHLNFHI